MSKDGSSKSSSTFGHARMNRRRRAHHDAQAAPPPAVEVPDHPHITAAEAEYIVEPAALEDFLDHARSVGLVAYDTEFIGESSYHPRLCLIQLATTRRVAVVDAMAELDLSPVWRMLADPALIKVVHAGAQDLEPVVRHLGTAPTAVFDAQIAAGFAGLPYPLSLLKLVHETIGVRLGKGLTFTSWDHRPLSRAHLRYAADDVRYLPAAYEALVPRLKALGHFDWAMQECAALCDPSRYVFDPGVQAGRVRGAKGVDGRDLAMLLELVALRDEGARAHDLPPRSFIKDEVLLDLIRRPPRDVQQLSAVRGLPRSVEQEYGPRIVQAAQRVMAQPRSAFPKSQEIEESAVERFQIDALWSALQCHCMARGVDPALVATRAELADHFRALQAGRLTDRHTLTQGWRSDLAGRFLADLLSGRADLNLAWHNGRLIANKP